MKVTRILWDMPITVEVIDVTVSRLDTDEVFKYFEHIDDIFSTYRSDSEISKINRGEIKLSHCSEEVKEILRLSEQTKVDTHGYFDIVRNGKYEPLGLVKGWAIQKASDSLRKKGFKHFYIEAGGDVQANGLNAEKLPWRVGIKNPFNQDELVKVLLISNKGVATSGVYERGNHIYNPKNPEQIIQDIVSMTIIGDTIYDADRFATAAFAMGADGINFIERLPGFEGYVIDKNGIATMTTGFKKYVYVEPN